MQIDPGDVVTAEVKKADVKQKAGLELYEKHGDILVKKAGGLFERRNIPILPGDRILEIFGRDIEDFEGGLDEINELMKTELKIWLKFERMDGEASSTSEEEEELLMLEAPKDDEESDEEEDAPLMLTNDDAGGNANHWTVDSASDDEVSEEDDDDNDDDAQEFKLFKYKAKPKLNGAIVKLISEADADGNLKVKLVSHPMRQIEVGAVIVVTEDNLKPL